MSKMIPRRSIDVLRHQVDVSLDLYGIACELYIPSNIDEVETFDVYQKPEDFTFTRYNATVFIEWSPNMYRLKHYGLYVEGELPIVVWFGNKAYNENNELVDVDIIRHSYIKVMPEYVPDNFEGLEEFELVDVIIKSMHDAVLVKSWKAVPRRFGECS